MFPDRVERMILDGNMNGKEYYKGAPETSLDDADDAVRSFFVYCAEAGPERCKFAVKGDNAKGVERRYLRLLQKLESAPLVLSDLRFPYPFIITKGIVMGKLYLAAYDPLGNFPPLAAMLAALDRGDAAAFFTPEEYAEAVKDSCSEPSAGGPNPFYNIGEPLQLVTCVDVANRYNIKTVEQYENMVKAQEALSTYGGRKYALQNGGSCIGMSIYPPASQRFEGM